MSGMTSKRSPCSCTLPATPCSNSSGGWIWRGWTWRGCDWPPPRSTTSSWPTPGRVPAARSSPAAGLARCLPPSTGERLDERRTGARPWARAGAPSIADLEDNHIAACPAQRAQDLAITGVRVLLAASAGGLAGPVLPDVQRPVGQPPVPAPWLPLVPHVRRPGDDGPLGPVHRPPVRTLRGHRPRHRHARQAPDRPDRTVEH